MRFLDPQDSEQQGLPPPPTVTSPNQLKASRNTLAWEARLQQPHVQAAQATALSRRGRPGFDGATDLFTSNWEASYYGVFNRLPRQQAAAAGADAGMPAADAPPADAAAGAAEPAGAAWLWDLPYLQKQLQRCLLPDAGGNGASAGADACVDLQALNELLRCTDWSEDSPVARLCSQLARSPVAGLTLEDCSDLVAPCLPQLRERMLVHARGVKVEALGTTGKRPWRHQVGLPAHCAVPFQTFLPIPLHVQSYAGATHGLQLFSDKKPKHLLSQDAGSGAAAPNPEQEQDEPSTSQVCKQARQCAGVKLTSPNAAVVSVIVVRDPAGAVPAVLAVPAGMLAAVVTPPAVGLCTQF